MKLNCFAVPFYISTIDPNKIKIKNGDLVAAGYSNTLTSFYSKNFITKECHDYLLKVFKELLSEDIKKDFNVEISNIWENKYIENSYHEKHIHPKSHFSFIIYKRIEKSNTVFYNPIDKLLQSFYCDLEIDLFDLFVESNFKQNQIILFPSFVEHMLKPNSNSETIAGNILLNIKNTHAL